VVVFENRSLDNVLGRLYGPGDGKTFEGVLGKDLTNPIPEWAEHGADRKVVPYTVATDMDRPNPDSGEEYPHTNTQLFGIQDEQNRFKLGAEITAPYNAPAPGQAPTMDGYVADYISCFTAEMGRQPTYEEYSQIMTGFTPEQVPVLSGLARGFGVFDHWFCEVPSQTLPNRSFWTAATSSAFSVNAPVKNFVRNNEPSLGVGHNDYHPACGRALGHGIAVQSMDPPSSILGGEAFLSRLYNAYQAMRSPTGSNVWNTALLIGWDGLPRHHVPPAGPGRPGRRCDPALM
jgi:hypothetical protein